MQSGVRSDDRPNGILGNCKLSDVEFHVRLQGIHQVEGEWTEERELGSRRCPDPTIADAHVDRVDVVEVRVAGDDRGLETIGIRRGRI